MVECLSKAPGKAVLSIGDVLAEAHGSWSSRLPVPGYRYQWERCASSDAGRTTMSGATGQAYTLTSADVGDTIRVQEAATSSYGTDSGSTSNPSGVVVEPPISTAAPTITGTATQGQALDETHGSWTDGPGVGLHLSMGAPQPTPGPPGLLRPRPG